MSNMSQNVNFDNLTEEQLDNLVHSAMSDSSPRAHPAPSLSAHSAPSLSAYPAPSAHPAPSAYPVPSAHPSPSAHPTLSLIEEIQLLRSENKALQTQLEHRDSTPKLSSTVKLSPAEIEAEFNSYKQNYTAYKNKQATAEYYAQRNKQREQSGYVDLFFQRPTVAFTNIYPVGDARCSQTNSRSSFTGVHLMGGGMSNVAIGLVGIYGSSR